MVPANPRPLLLPTTVTSLSPSKMETSIFLPISKSLRSSSRHSVSHLPGARLAFLNTPASGLFRRLTVAEPEVTLMAEYPPFSLVLSSITVAGGNSMMVTATLSPFSLNIWVMPSLVPISPSILHLYFHFHAGREIQLHQGVDRLGGGVDDVDQTLVRPRFELFPRCLVDMRGADHKSEEHTSELQ